QMSLPWQTDFVDCSDGDSPLVWWPAQRPIDVRLENSDPKGPAVRWARDFKGNTSDVTAREMVDEWWRLGVLKPVSHGVVEILRMGMAAESYSGLQTPSQGIVSVWGGREHHVTDFLLGKHGAGWHVDRAVFDRMLADNARSAGATVRTRSRMITAPKRNRTH